MIEIQRYGNSKRWADVVVYRGVAHWVEVADDMSLDARGQIAQVRAMVQVGLGTGCRVEMVVTAAVPEG
jgi:hypothetical protein